MPFFVPYAVVLVGEVTSLKNALCYGCRKMKVLRAGSKYSHLVQFLLQDLRDLIYVFKFSLTALVILQVMQCIEGYVTVSDRLTDLSIMSSSEGRSLVCIDSLPLRPGLMCTMTT